MEMPERGEIDVDRVTARGLFVSAALVGIVFGGQVLAFWLF